MLIAALLGSESWWCIYFWASCTIAAATDDDNDATTCTEFGIRDKKNIPNTVSVLGILFH